MLQQLSIKNFALIDHLQVSFKDGFSTITGETGAGKSIIIGGLGLILGNRADLSVLKSEDKKCVVEGEFYIKTYQLMGFFKENDIDYEDLTIIRREISPSGKSRAFINDTPVRLSVLNDFADKLVDIHSQHQTLQLADTKFQFRILDALAENGLGLHDYRLHLKKYQNLQKQLEDLKKNQQEAKLQYDYNLFLFNELKEAKVNADEQALLEETLDKLNNIEVIKQNFEEAIALANTDEVGIASSLNTFKRCLNKLSTFGKDFAVLLDRFNSLEIEFSDIVDELEKANDNIDVSPEEIEQYGDRLSLLYSLQKKHAVSSNIELLQIQETLAKKVDAVENADELFKSKELELHQLEAQIDNIAEKLHKKRKSIIPYLINTLESLLAQLSMPNTQFKIDLVKTDTFFSNGKDELHFLFSANRGIDFESLKKVASGGEMSRIMLAVKALMCQHTHLPTIIFDEIDTGVSGEVSNKIAEIMQQMGKHMQVIAITHLPQIASRGSDHYKVYKIDDNNQTVTNIKHLTKEERIDEIAEMLSGKEPSFSAIEHAKQLLAYEY